MKRILSSILLLSISILSISAQEENVTMMTYNIKGWAMTASKIADVAKVINYYTPDVVAIQEVNKRPFIVWHDYLEDLSKATGLKGTFFPLVGNHYGIGLLSKTDPIKIETKAFPFSDSSKDKEDRGIIIAEYPDFFFVSTHYSLNADDRDTATAWLCTFAAYSDKAVFVAGDFNAAPTYRAMVTFRNRGFKILNDISQFTIPSDKPTKCIDMVICYNNFPEAKKYKVLASGIANTPGVDLAIPSDHLPVYVKLEPLSGSVEGVEAEAVKVYAKGNTIQVEGLTEGTNYQISDISGRIVAQGLLGQGNAEISTSNILAGGMYIITLNNETQYLSKKILFNH
ncbi:MAG: endonuclease/exonuclease/phosphatase family protein [Muribaculaceae bacterium]|nr:endonuclease/exonuclease/phosphatase family protein [Muribaculaceae bacterium]